MNEKWEEAKEIVGKMTFPDENSLNWQEIKELVGRHRLGKKHHPLKGFRMVLPPVLDYELQARISRCEECGKIRNKYFVLYNPEDNVVFIDWRYRAKWEEGKELKEKVKKLFFPEN
jgi:hypothetical protein